MTSKALLILFEGFPPHVIDSQVLLHARAMREKGIVDFEIWSFAPSNALYKKSLERLEEVQDLSQSTVRVFRGIKPAIPFSDLLNAFLVWQKIRKFKPSFNFIHARTDYTASVLGFLNLFRQINIIWDCRGDAEAEFRARFSSDNIILKILSLYQVALIRWRVFWSAFSCQKAIFVTHELKERVGSHLQEKEFEIIPGVASKKMFYFDETLRRNTRHQLGYSDEDTVVIYSGSLASYQNFPECVAVFRDLYRRHGNFKFLVVTQERETAEKELSDLPAGSYKVLSAMIIQVNAYLNAADHALLLRKYSPVNRVASPTKFAEYCLAGLSIIMQDSIPESFALAKRLGNLSEFVEGKVVFCEPRDRNELNAEYQLLLTRSAVLPRYRELYSF